MIRAATALANSYMVEEALTTTEDIVIDRW